MNMNRVFRNLPNPFDPKVQQSLGSSIGKILLGGSALIYAASSSFWTGAALVTAWFWHVVH
jgi:hypothetical protein